jgi:putative FmdB family regulatory protein
MPLYEYECEACGHRFEVIQKYSDAPIETCVKCGGTVRKLLSSPAIQFKGSGWYITDYARAGKNDGAGGSGKSDGSAKAETKSDTTTDSKPEAKSDNKGETKGGAKSESSSTASSSPPSSSSSS